MTEVTAEAPDGRGTARRGALVLVDQGLSSASNFMLVILVARTVDTAGFGTFSIVFSCLTLGLGLTRASVGVPLNVDLPRADRATADSSVARSLAAGTAVGAVLAVVIVILALTLADGPLRGCLLVLAVGVPVVVVQDVGRYVAVALAAPRHAVVSDGLWVLMAAAGLVVSSVRGGLTPALASGVWVAGGALGLVALRPCLRGLRWHGTWEWFVGDRRRWHLSIDALTSAVTPLLVVSALAAIVSPAAVGALRGASTLMSPINVAIAAVSLGAVSEITRRDWPQARRFVMLVCAGLVVVTLVWGLLALVLPDRVGHGLLGETWPSARRVVPFSIAEFVGLAVWNGAVALLRSSDRTRASAVLRICYLALAVVTTTTAAVTLASARGVQTALAVSAAVLAVVTWVRAWPPTGAGGARAAETPR